MTITKSPFSTIQKATDLAVYIADEQPTIADIIGRFGGKNDEDIPQVHKIIDAEIAEAKKFKKDEVLSPFIGKHILCLNLIKMHIGQIDHYKNRANATFKTALFAPFFMASITHIVSSYNENQSLLSLPYVSDDYYGFAALSAITSCCIAFFGMIFYGKAQQNEYKRELGPTPEKNATDYFGKRILKCVAAGLHTESSHSLLGDTVTHHYILISLNALARDNLREIQSLGLKYKLPKLPAQRINSLARPIFSAKKRNALKEYIEKQKYGMFDFFGKEHKTLLERKDSPLEISAQAV